MDIQNFIDSGALEAYVLGACTEDERQEVARMASAHPEVRAALARIETDMEQVTRRLGVEPPPGSRQRVLDAVARAQNPGGTGGGAQFGLWSWVGLVLAVALGGALGYGYAHVQHTPTQLELAATQLELKLCETQQQAMDTLQRQYALLSNTATRRFDIVPLDADQYPLQAFVFANPDATACLVAAADMGRAPAGKSYQLWALVDGTPVSMGVLDPALPAGALREVACVPNAQGYAISLEPEGGSPTPTTVIMMSNS